MSKEYYDPRDILTIPAVPELDWLKEFIKTLSVHDPAKNKLELTYKYLLWSRRYALVPDEKAKRACYGMVVKYHRPLWDLEIEFEAERQCVSQGEAAIELSNRAIRARREGAEARTF